MISERRTFMKTCACLVAGGLASPATLAAPAMEKRKWTVKELSRENFEQWIGSDFRVTKSGEAPVTLRLLSVEDTSKRLQGPDAPALRLESFSVLFEASPETPLEQDNYDFSHPQHGDFTVMMTPVVSNRSAVRQYEVVFSRLIEGQG